MQIKQMHNKSFGLGKLMAVGLSLSLSACVGRPDLSQWDDEADDSSSASGGHLSTGGGEVAGGPNSSPGGTSAGGVGGAPAAGGPNAGAGGQGSAGAPAFAECEPSRCGPAPAIYPEACGEGSIALHCQALSAGRICEWYLECRVVTECNDLGGVCTLPGLTFPPNYAQVAAGCPGSADVCWVPLGSSEGSSGEGGATNGGSSGEAGSTAEGGCGASGGQPTTGGVESGGVENGGQPTTGGVESGGQPATGGAENGGVAATGDAENGGA